MRSAVHRQVSAFAMKISLFGLVSRLVPFLVISNAASWSVQGFGTIPDQEKLVKGKIQSLTNDFFESKEGDELAQENNRVDFFDTSNRDDFFAPSYPTNDEHNSTGDHGTTSNSPNVTYPPKVHSPSVNHTSREHSKHQNINSSSSQPHFVINAQWKPHYNSSTLKNGANSAKGANDWHNDHHNYLPNNFYKPEAIHPFHILGPPDKSAITDPGTVPSSVQKFETSFYNSLLESKFPFSEEKERPWYHEDSHQSTNEATPRPLYPTNEQQQHEAKPRPLPQDQTTNEQNHETDHVQTIPDSKSGLSIPNEDLHTASSGLDKKKAYKKGYHHQETKKGQKGFHDNVGQKKKLRSDYGNSHKSDYHDKTEKEYEEGDHKSKKYGDWYKGEKKKKGHDHLINAHHNKGHKDKGFKNVYHKEEYGHSKKFYDVYDVKKKHKNFDDYDFHFQNLKGDIYKSDQHKGHNHHDASGKEGQSHKGSDQKDLADEKKKYAHNEHYGQHNEQEHKGEARKKFSHPNSNYIDHHGHYSNLHENIDEPQENQTLENNEYKGNSEANNKDLDGNENYPHYRENSEANNKDLDGNENYPHYRENSEANNKDLDRNENYPHYRENSEANNKDLDGNENYPHYRENSEANNKDLDGNENYPHYRENIEANNKDLDGNENYPHYRENSEANNKDLDENENYPHYRENSEANNKDLDGNENYPHYRENSEAKNKDLDGNEKSRENKIVNVLDDSSVRSEYPRDDDRHLEFQKEGNDYESTKPSYDWYHDNDTNHDKTYRQHINSPDDHKAYNHDSTKSVSLRTAPPNHVYEYLDKEAVESTTNGKNVSLYNKNKLSPFVRDVGIQCTTNYHQNNNNSDYYSINRESLNSRPAQQIKGQSSDIVKYESQMPQKYYLPDNRAFEASNTASISKPFGHQVTQYRPTPAYYSQLGDKSLFLRSNNAVPSKQLTPIYSSNFSIIKTLLKPYDQISSYSFYFQKKPKLSPPNSPSLNVTYLTNSFSKKPQLSPPSFPSLNLTYLSNSFSKEPHYSPSQRLNTYSRNVNIIKPNHDQYKYNLGASHYKPGLPQLKHHLHYHSNHPHIKISQGSSRYHNSKLLYNPYKNQESRYASANLRPRHESRQQDSYWRVQLDNLHNRRYVK